MSEVAAGCLGHFASYRSEPMPEHDAVTPARILSIEDDAAIGQFLQAVLSANGYTVDLAADGKEGLDLVRTRRPDVIILDLLMPYKSGFEVLRELKDTPTTSGIPIVILSSNSREEDIVHALNAGADDFIIKPFRARELLARVRKVLGPSAITPPPSP